MGLDGPAGWPGPSEPDPGEHPAVDGWVLVPSSLEGRVSCLSPVTLEGALDPFSME